MSMFNSSLRRMGCWHGLIMALGREGRSTGLGIIGSHLLAEQGRVCALLAVAGIRR
jgi:hypothetical protein